MIKNHEIKRIKQTAANKKTYYFLMQLDKNVRCKNTSDFQGGDKDGYWYNTKIKDKTIGVDMKKERSIFWKVNKIYFIEK